MALRIFINFLAMFDAEKESLLTLNLNNVTNVCNLCTPCNCCLYKSALDVANNSVTQGPGVGSLQTLQLRICGSPSLVIALQIEGVFLRLKSLSLTGIMVCLLCVALACAAVFLLSFLASVFIGQPASIKGKHVLITGGSSGIGKWCAIEVVKRGANVTLLARDRGRLEAAKSEVESHCVDRVSQKVVVQSVDITGDYDAIERCVMQSEEELGPIAVLMNCAGFAIASRLEDMRVADIKRLMDVNFMGTCLITRAVIPSMKSHQRGHIVFTSSQAGLLGVYGYTAYSAAKFALRGFAETLRAEVKPYNVHITLAFPPDTDTPGFAEEEKTKPLETRLISESSGLASPKDVAAVIVLDMLRGRFFSTVGLDGLFLRVLCAGMAPVSSMLDLTMQFFFMGILRIVAVLMLLKFDRIVSKCRTKKDQDKKLQ